VQGEIPFFRDTYETSAFLATQLAIGNVKNLETPNNFPSNISNQLLAPRIFEVKRNGEILPFAWYGPGVPVRSPQNHDGEHEDNSLVADIAPLLTDGRSEWRCWKGDDLSKCGYIQPALLATQLAIGNIAKNLETLNIFPRKIPPIFEKAARYCRSPGMDREFVFLRRKITRGNTRKVADTTPLTEGRSERPCGDPSKCRYIQPVDPEELKKLTDPKKLTGPYPKAIEKLFPTFEETGLNLAVGVLFGLGLLCAPKVRRSAGVVVCLVVLALGTGALACANWERFAPILTEHGEGEPIVMLQGVSVWPTVLLRILGIILAGYFIWRVQHNLHDNLVEISEDMQLDPPDMQLDPPDKRSLLNKIAGFFPHIVHEIAGVFRDKRSFSEQDLERL
jgi:hypothetical protein